MNEAARKNTLTKKLMYIMERRNKEWIFVSRKRMVFMLLRDETRKERAFREAIVKSFTRTMKMKGFHYIKNTYLDFNYHDKVTRLMKKFVNRYHRINGLDAFNKWKTFSIYKVNEKYM